MRWLAALLVFAGCGVEADRAPGVTVDSSGIVGGSATTQWTGIGYMSDGEMRCTATLVSTNVMLTAAHCTARGTEIRVGFGDYQSFEHLTIRAVRVRRSPDYDGKDPVHDVATLVIDRAMPDPSIPVAGANPGLGSELRAVGYGDATSGLNEFEVGGAKPRKTAHVQVTETHSTWVITTGLNGAACFGDSGGPLMDLDGTRIYGVMSGIFKPCTSKTRNTWAMVAGESFIEEEIRNHPPVGRGGSTVLWRYWNGTNTDHYYTIDRNDGGLAFFGYGIEKGEGFVFRDARPGTVPLLRYWNATAGDHFYTIYPGELGFGAGGYALEGIAAYCFPRPYTGTTPLHRYFNGTLRDHYYSTTRDDLGAAIFGYAYEGAACWVFP